MSKIKQFKIGIYSGDIPSTTFIENLIIGLSNHFIIHVYGRLNKKVNYSSKNIKVYSNPKNNIKRILFFVYRFLKCSIFHYSDFKKCMQNIRAKSFTEAFAIFEKLIPIIIYPPDLIHFQWPTSLRYFEPILDDYLTVLSLRGRLINIVPFVYPKVMNEYIEKFKKIDAFHSVSKDLINISRDFIDEKSIVKVIMPAVNEKLLNISKSEWNYSTGNTIKIISVGGNRWKKGFTYALDAMKILKSKKIKFHYTIVAPGKDVENINYQISDLGLNKFISYIPGLDHNDTLQIMKNSHLYLLPSLNEGIANVVIESMALGIPVISTNCSGMSEVINDEENGYLVPVRSPKLIAEKIISILNKEKSELDQIIFKAKETIKVNHLIDHQIISMRDFYNEILYK